MRLEDKVIIVTGATSGIGQAIAVAAVREGAKVLVHGINEEEGKAVVAKLGSSTQLCIADLSERTAPAKIVAAALAAFGRIDGLVNNAAIIARSNLAELTPDEVERVLQVNLKAPVFLIQAAYADLKASRGAVLNIGSINAYAGESSLLAYSISKGALATMTRNLANAHGVHGIRINQINPGWVLTEREDRDQVAKGLAPGWHQRLDRTAIPFGVMTTPQQMGEAAIYWLGDESRPFTGTILDLEQFSVIGRNSEKL